MSVRCALLSLFIGASNIVAAQSIYNGTSVFIPASINIYSGNVENHGFIMNNGTIEITGDWNNQRVYQGLGTIVLSGDDQNIDNNDQSIKHLLIGGSGTKELNGKLLIDGSIEFATGIIHVAQEDTLWIKEEASIEGGSGQSYVDGALVVEGTGYKFFPVGRNGAYSPVALTDIKGVNTVTQLAAFKDLRQVQTSTPVDIDNNVYWMQQTIDGSYSGSPISASVNINIDEEERIVFVAADNFHDDFDVIENDDIHSSGGITFVTSSTSITKSIFAVGELPEKPVIPGYLSTTLSPNASNTDNRLIKIFGADVRPDNFHFQVVNRWGNTVYESRSFDDLSIAGWDGKFSGQILPAGAYPYSLTYTDRKGKESTSRGFITILY